jgi:hypothetical protein
LEKNFTGEKVMSEDEENSFEDESIDEMAG